VIVQTTMSEWKNAIVVVKLRLKDIFIREPIKWDDLSENIKNILTKQISNNYNTVISNTLYPFKLVDYKYDKENNIITMKYTIPSDIVNTFIGDEYADNPNYVMPKDDDIFNKWLQKRLNKYISETYGELATDTWLGGDVTLYIHDDKQYDIYDFQFLGSKLIVPSKDGNREYGRLKPSRKSIKRKSLKRSSKRKSTKRKSSKKPKKLSKRKSSKKKTKKLNRK